MSVLNWIFGLLLLGVLVILYDIWLEQFGKLILEKLRR